MTCIFDPFGCLSASIGSAIASVPWYWWVVVALVVCGVVWKVAGTPGLLALAAGVGFILGRRSVEPEPVEVPDEDPPHIRRLKQSQGVVRKEKMLQQGRPKRRFNPSTNEWE